MPEREVEGQWTWHTLASLIHHSPTKESDLAACIKIVTSLFENHLYSFGGKYRKTWGDR